MISLRRLSTLILPLAIFVTATASAQSPGSPWQREPEEIRRTLDSLASVSIGSYVHFAVGSCLGGRCETRVSIHRDMEDAPYRYRAAGWVGLPKKPQFYGTTRELEEADAGAILADARMAGLMALVSDTTPGDRRQPRFWLRARFGTTTLSIDGASLGSPSYVASVDGGPGVVYDKVEKALLVPLRRQFQARSGGE